MADDLVVREWAPKPGRGDYVYVTPEHVAEHNALARAYLAVVGERDATGERHDVTATALRVRTSQLAAMTAERDIWKARSGGECYDDQVIRIAAERNALQAQLTASEAALRKYGRHLSYCSYRPHGVGETASAARGKCTCGFNEGECIAGPEKVGEP